MSSNNSVVSSSDSIDNEAMMAVLEAPVPPKKKAGRPKKVKVVEVEVVAPVVEVESEKEDESVSAPETEVESVSDDDKVESELAEADAYMVSEAGGPIGFVAKYKALLKHNQELLSKQTKPKNDNSPPEEGVHMRMVDGVKTKCRYIFPYAADGGKSIVKMMKEGQKCVGVSTTQKNNTKKSCKTADYDLIWVNAKVVRDTKTGKLYSHKDGKFAVMNEEDMTSFNVRMMIVA